MLTETQEGRMLVNEVAYRLVSENAPEELPLYVSTRDRYFGDPQGFGQPDEDEDEALGFGAAAAVETFIQIGRPKKTTVKRSESKIVELDGSRGYCRVHAGAVGHDGECFCCFTNPM